MLEFVVIAALAYFGYAIWQGYTEAEKPPLPMMDPGSGILEPVCPHCKARLVLVQRKSGGGLAGVMALLIGLAGVFALFFNWIIGLVAIILAVLISMAGKSQRSVLACPAHGDIKTLS
jgi:hypothetical protein